MLYKPQPIDVSHVKLSDDLKQLVEILAKNTHKVWADTRIKDGWTYGEKRNDKLKQHPCLLPYEEISESEKEYDRTITKNVIKSLIKLGYIIEKS